MVLTETDKKNKARLLRDLKKAFPHLKFTVKVERVTKENHPYFDPGLCLTVTYGTKIGHRSYKKDGSAVDTAIASAGRYFHFTDYMIETV